MSNHRGYLSSLYEINWLPKNYFVTQEAGLPFKCFFFFTNRCVYKISNFDISCTFLSTFAQVF